MRGREISYQWKHNLRRDCRDCSEQRQDAEGSEVVGNAKPNPAFLSTHLRHKRRNLPQGSRQKDQSKYEGPAFDYISKGTEE